MDPSRSYHRRQICAFRAFRLRSVLQSIKTALYRTWRQEPRSPILGLLMELVVAIVYDIPLVANACLALTCKTFYRLLGHVQRLPELHHPPNMVFKRSTATLNSARENCLNSQRWEFIRRLEGDRWLACSSRVKLHPLTQFRPNQILFQQHGTRVCHLGYYSGFVDLCPCLKMTFQDKHRLAEKWKRFLDSNPTAANERVPWHSCSHAFLSDTVIYQTTIYPRLKRKTLVLDLEYTFKFTGPTHFLKRLGKRVCPHHNLFDFITQDLACPLAAIPNPPSIRMKQVSRVQNRCPTLRVPAAPALHRHPIHDFPESRTCAGRAQRVPDQAWYIQSSFSRDDVELEWWYDCLPESATNPSLAS